MNSLCGWLVSGVMTPGVLLSDVRRQHYDNEDKREAGVCRCQQLEQAQVCSCLGLRIVRAGEAFRPSLAISTVSLASY
jgi:hypothetical protein